MSYIQCRFIYCLCILSIICTEAYAQNSFDNFKRQMEERFNDFKDTKNKEFEEYRNRINQEFADFMRKKWDAHEAEPAVPAPPQPEPPEPVVADPKDKPSNDTLPLSVIIPRPEVPEMPVPLIPDYEWNDPLIRVTPDLPSDPIALHPTKPTGKGLSFIFYGSRCNLPFNKPLMADLMDVYENSVADAWNKLSCDETIDLVGQCVELRDKLRLPDWGYFKLTENVAQTLCPGDANSSTLLQMFLLTQSGYKVRIGRKGDRLVLLIPSNNVIYNYLYINKSGQKYYVIDSDKQEKQIYVFDQEFPREQLFSLAIRRQPNLSVNDADSKHFSMSYPLHLEVDVAVNSNLIDFYNDYPQSSQWDHYSHASLSEEVKEQLYPTLIKAIEGKDKVRGANILLHFVQTAFKYMTDGDQFGYERPFFPDETFHYPYSDCEDRAILFSVLVRELLGLDCVLVHYPDHLATAVKFDGDVNGDYFLIEGTRYTVCDPTYINADVGMSMQQYKNASAEILKL